MILKGYVVQSEYNVTGILWADSYDSDPNPPSPLDKFG